MVVCGHVSRNLYIGWWAYSVKIQVSCNPSRTVMCKCGLVEWLSVDMFQETFKLRGEHIRWKSKFHEILHGLWCASVDWLNGFLWKSKLVTCIVWFLRWRVRSLFCLCQWRRIFDSSNANEGVKRRSQTSWLWHRVV